MALDLIIRNARLSGAGSDNPTVDIGVRGGIIVAGEPKLAGDGPEHDARGKLVSPGLIESHFHLDKAMITERAAKLMRLGDYGIEVGKAADLVVWNEALASDVIAKCALPLAGFKRGRRIFLRELPTLQRPPKTQL